jgi:hypothetical protein
MYRKALKVSGFSVFLLTVGAESFERRECVREGGILCGRQLAALLMALIESRRNYVYW